MKIPDCINEDIMLRCENGQRQMEERMSERATLLLILDPGKIIHLYKFK